MNRLKISITFPDSKTYWINSNHIVPAIFFLSRTIVSIYYYINLHDNVATVGTLSTERLSFKLWVTNCEVSLYNMGRPLWENATSSKTWLVHENWTERITETSTALDRDALLIPFTHTHEFGSFIFSRLETKAKDCDPPWRSDFGCPRTSHSRVLTPQRAASNKQCIRRQRRRDA
jgi:hypothetical protein